MSRKTLLILLAVALGAGSYFGYQYWQGLQSKLPPGIASGNGRLEAKLVDIAAKEPLRVKQIFFNEGDLVKPGDVVVQMDTNTLEAQLAEAKMNVVATQEKEAVARATIQRTKAQIDLAKIEVKRSKSLVAQRAGSQRELDVRNTQLKTTSASLQEEVAKLSTIQQQVAVARAQVATVQTRIDDATLRSPVLGRVLYKLAEVGEVLAAGGKAMTLVNLEDVYMEIFLPSADAGRVEDRRRRAHRLRPDPGPIRRRISQLCVAGGAIYPETGGDAQRTRKADVSREDQSAGKNRDRLHRNDQDRRARRRLCQAGRLRSVARLAAEHDHPPEFDRQSGREGNREVRQRRARRGLAP